jgi:hypothetical protein
MSPGDGELIGPPYLEVVGGLLPWSSAAIAKSGIEIVIAHNGVPTPECVEPLPNLAFAHIPIKIFGGFGGQSRTSIATRHLSDFVRAIIPVQTVDVVTADADDPKAFDEIGVIDGRTWRSNDTRASAERTRSLLPLTNEVARRHQARVVAFGRVDSRVRTQQDALEQLWSELALPRIIPRAPVLRENQCSTALKILGDRVRLDLTAT